MGNWINIMFYQRFYFQVILRVVLITLNCFFFVLTYKAEGYIVVSANLALLIIIQTLLLIGYVYRLNRDLTNFFNSIKSGDPVSIISKKGTGAAFKDLDRSFDEVNEAIRNVRIDKEQQYRYFQYVVEHIGSGLISYNQHGKVEIFNDAAKDLLKIPRLFNVKELDQLQQGFSKFLSGLEPFQQKLFQIRVSDEVLQLSIKATLFKIQEDNIRLISLQNIRHELDKKELDSWHKLIRVLTHEIMNSISPITSLTSTIAQYFRKPEKKEPIPLQEINEKTLFKTLEGLDTIEERGKGLVNFINNYRSFTKLPSPVFSNFEIAEIFQSTRLLLEDKLDSAEISLKEKIIPTGLNLYADKKLVEQIIINLVNNSIQAMEKFPPNRGEIYLLARKGNGNVVEIQVRDNGPGIPDDVTDKVFIPFYTTRKRGSGIGLSLSRQFMQLHGGTISVYSVPNVETVFTLKF